MNRFLASAHLIVLGLFAGCGEDTRPAEAPPKTNRSTTNIAKESFSLPLPDGRTISVWPDMDSPNLRLSTLEVLKRDCQRALWDEKQKDVEVLDRTIKVLVEVRSSYRDENGNWHRYRHEPEPVFESVRIRDLGKVEITAGQRETESESSNKAATADCEGRGG